MESQSNTNQSELKVFMTQLLLNDSQSNLSNQANLRQLHKAFGYSASNPSPAMEKWILHGQGNQ